MKLTLIGLEIGIWYRVKEWFPWSVHAFICDYYLLLVYLVDFDTSLYSGINT